MCSSWRTFAFTRRRRPTTRRFARALASLADLYVNDAFGTAHRAHASTEGVTHFLPAVAGFLMEKEIDYLSRALESPDRPFVAVIGGSKVSDKIGVLENLLGKVDALLIGGGMANTFLLAQGLGIGQSLAEPDKAALAADIMAKAKAAGVKLLLPVDVVIADRFAADAQSRVVGPDQVDPAWRILDIGPATVAAVRERAQARAGRWSGTAPWASLSSRPSPREPPASRSPWPRRRQ